MQHKKDGKLSQLIEKYIQKETNASENKIVEDYFDSFSSLPNVLENMSPEERAIIKRRMQEKLHRRLSGKPIRLYPTVKNFRKIAAAAAVLLASLAVTVYHYQPFSTSKKNQVLTLKSGEQREVILPDGTKVRLNASSKLIYPNSFDDASRREITLIGEAFFDVVKKSDKPFLIHTPRMEIQVLGTAFNVRDYKEDKIAETSLIEGKVAVWKTGQAADRFLLKPKEKFVVTEKLPVNNNQMASKHPVKQLNATVEPVTISKGDGTTLETEWLLKRMTIEEESLSQIAQRLERMYGIKIVISNPEVAKQHYSATFENEHLDNVIGALQVVKPFRYKKDDQGNIEIY
ncbi:FecR family protein [Olivibacter sp. XZL3]|uniref:FecR family protein n=1 Tax=Olivibacter sp. XZL3 TaxID=1735116 RepID=UPI0010662D6F|nr:FecR family protein [Olivibacter sp. XZL3]